MPLMTPVATVAVRRDEGDEGDENDENDDETTHFLPVRGFDNSSDEECGGGTRDSSSEDPYSPVSDGYYTPDDQDVVVEV